MSRPPGPSCRSPRRRLSNSQAVRRSIDLELLGAILGHFGERYSDWLSVGGDAEESFLQADYRARCATLNRPVVVTPVLGSPYPGLATDIDDQGRLLVVREDGGLESIAAADIRHLRQPTD